MIGQAENDPTKRKWRAAARHSGLGRTTSPYLAFGSLIFGKVANSTL